jgi:hypothetical protein
MFVDKAEKLKKLHQFPCFSTFSEPAALKKLDALEKADSVVSREAWGTRAELAHTSGLKSQGCREREG